MLKPTKGVIVSTFKCTAECPECCFECSPRNNKQLSYEEITRSIDKLKAETDINKLIWTGGECFLLGEDLEKGISYAKQRGIYSRCVTNGFWATNEKIADKKLEKLKKAGMVELNLSTGDEHQLFVPENNIINAIVAAAKLGIHVALAIETRKNARVTKEKLIKNSQYQKKIIEEDLEKYVSIMNASWVSFHKDNIFEYEEDDHEYIISNGCDSIFDVLCLTPHKEIVGCCGLCIEHIPEMTLGKEDKNLMELYSSQFDDFLKIWLYVDGPRIILEYLQGKNKNLNIPKFMHACQACAYIYNNAKIKKEILNSYKNVYNDVIDRFTAKQILNQYEY